MTLTRRRFLTISAAAATVAPAAQAASWQGRAFGGDVSLSLSGPRAITEPALAASRALLREIEARFSLYDPHSDLRALNRIGHLAPDPHMRALLQAAQDAYSATEGLFDPTVQTLWQALAHGTDLQAARARIGLDRVRISPAQVALAKGQALTFNGIAQGYATDRVTELLRAHGLEKALVNIGEYRALNGPFGLGLEDPNAGYIGHRTVTDRAIATSSPSAMQIGNLPHILHAAAQPHWSTVSVEAETATRADALSTGLSLAPISQVKRLRERMDDVHRITLVDADGDVITL